MLSRPAADAILGRLERAEGLVRDIRGAVRAGETSEQLLRQLADAQNALGKVVSMIFRFHVEHCVLGDGPDSHGVDHEEWQRLIEIVDKFIK